MIRIVVKIGSQIIVNNEKEKTNSILEKLVEEMVHLKKEGFIFTIVTSGAVAMAKHHISNKEDASTSSKQALASIGQIYLMKKYSKYFDKFNIKCAQVLVGRENFNSRIAYLNVRNTLEKLYDLNAIPIINENDAVSTEEIEGQFYGDNDRLSAIVANAIDADLLILFGEMDGLYSKNPEKNPDAKLIKDIKIIDEKIISYAEDSENEFGSGGMASKLEAAKICMNSGIGCVISSPYQKGIIKKIIQRKNVGTYFHPNSSKIESKKRWLFTGISESKGALIIDEGAKRAIIEKGASLLPVGVVAVEGKFQRGDIIVVKDSKMNEIAWGIINYDFEDTNKLKGIDSQKIDNIIKINHGSEIIHRNNLVTLNFAGEVA
ncbi:MAG: glutamate 5-kinase [Dehalococcoidia bacterium]|nr:glutamate 5-kinase [Dehalococcoidia bacterium]